MAGLSGGGPSDWRARPRFSSLDKRCLRTIRSRHPAGCSRCLGTLTLAKCFGTPWTSRAAPAQHRVREEIVRRVRRPACGVKLFWRHVAGAWRVGLGEGRRIVRFVLDRALVRGAFALTVSGFGPVARRRVFCAGLEAPGGLVMRLTAGADGSGEDLAFAAGRELV